MPTVLRVKGFRYWRLVAILEIEETFCNHNCAYNWYNTHGKVPSNCIHSNNPRWLVELDKNIELVEELKAYFADELHQEKLEKMKALKR